MEEETWKRITITISKKEFDKLVAEAISKKKSRSAIVRIALAEYFKKLDWMPEKAKEIIRGEAELKKINEIVDTLLDEEIYLEFKKRIYTMYGYACFKGLDDKVKALADKLAEIKEIIPEDAKKLAEWFIEKVKEMGYKPNDIFFNIKNGGENNVNS